MRRMGMRLGAVALAVAFVGAAGGVVVAAHASPESCASGDFASAGADGVCAGATGSPGQYFVGDFTIAGVSMRVRASGGRVVVADAAQPSGVTTYDGMVWISVWCTTADCDGTFDFFGYGRGTYTPLDPNKLRLVGQAGGMTFDVNFHGYSSYALGPRQCGEYGCPPTPNPDYPGFLTRPAVGSGTFSDPVLGISFHQTGAPAEQDL